MKLLTHFVTWTANNSYSNVAELAAFLDNLDPEYAQYADALWQKDIRTSRQLSNASKHILISAGLLELHADDIKASAFGTGEHLAYSNTCHVLMHMYSDFTEHYQQVDAAC